MAVWQERAELLFKEEGLEKLKNSNVLIVGLGVRPAGLAAR